MTQLFDSHTNSMMAGMATVDQNILTPAAELADACDSHLDDWWRHEAPAVSNRQEAVLEIGDGNEIEVTFSQDPTRPDLVVVTSGKLRRTVYQVRDNRIDKIILDKTTDPTGA